jgi:vitamin B12 transporter
MRKWLRFSMIFVALAIWAGAAGGAEETAGPAAAGAEAETGETKEAVVLEDVVITGTKTPVPVKESSLSSTVITEKEIQERQAFRAEEMVRSVPGVIISQSGSAGGITSLFLRGGNSNYTQVLYNGIRLNDTGGNFDWNILTVDNVERIEVIRGPMSSLYGADAMTGVINLQTKKGVGPPSLSLNGAWGAHSENGYFIGENRASLLGSYGKFGYSLAYSRIDDDGILRVNNRFANNVVNGRFDYDPLENLSFTAYTWFVDSRFGVPTENGGDRFDTKAAGGPGLDPDQKNARKDVLLGLKGNYWPFNWWENELTLAFTQFDRHFDDPANPSESTFDALFGSYFSRDLEQRYSLDYHANLRFGDRKKVDSVSTVGVAARSDRFKQRIHGTSPFVGDFADHLKTNRTSTAFYLQEQLSFWERLFLTGGFRVEDNSVFDKVEFSPRASAAFRITETDTTIRAAGGRAIKEPTFLESFSRSQLSAANPNLKPEVNVSWEVGADQYWQDKIKFSLTYFENHFTDLITFVPRVFPLLSSFENIGEVRTTGLELGLTAKMPFGLTAGVVYTHLFQFTVLDDGGHGGLFFANGKHLLRRPRHAFSFDLDYSKPKYGVHLNGLFVGSRDDSKFIFSEPFNFGSARVTNGSFFIVNLAGYYTLAENLGYIKKAQLQARINNLFDRDYEEVYGFSSPGFSFLAGLRVIM